MLRSNHENVQSWQPKEGTTQETTVVERRIRTVAEGEALYKRIGDHWFACEKVEKHMVVETMQLGTATKEKMIVAKMVGIKTSKTVWRSSKV